MNLLALILAATIYTVEPVNGTVSFTIMKWGVFKEEGTFREFSGRIVYDKTDVAKSKVEFEIEAESVDTKNKNRDSTLRSPEFLDVKKYPALRFRSVRVVPRPDGLANVTGDLTIHGVTKRITVPVRLVGTRKEGKTELAGFETTFTIDRRHFGVTGGRWVAESPNVLGNEVTIRIVAGGVAR